MPESGHAFEHDFGDEPGDEFDAAFAAMRRPADRGARLATGFWTLDGAVGGGLLPTHLLLISGRGGVGKSTLALDLATRMAAGSLAGRTVAYVSPDVPAFELNNRVRRARRIGVDAGVRRPPWAGPDGFVRAVVRGVAMSTLLEAQAEAALRDDGLAVMPRPPGGACTMAAVERHLDAVLASSHARGRPLGMVVVDGLGLLETDGQSAGRSQLAALRRLRAFGKAYAVPVVVVTSLRPALPGLHRREPRFEDLPFNARRLGKLADTVVLMDAPPLLRRTERPLFVRNQGDNRHCGALDVLLTAVTGRYRYAEDPEQLQALLAFQAAHRS
jgi:KaiC/GvpD/RAD55 family RecA-like ATPase